MGLYNQVKEKSKEIKILHNITYHKISVNTNAISKGKNAKT